MSSTVSTNQEEFFDLLDNFDFDETLLLKNSGYINIYITDLFN